MKNPYTQILNGLTDGELIALASKIQAEQLSRSAPKKSIYQDLEKLAKQAGISIKELEFLR